MKKIHPARIARAAFVTVMGLLAWSGPASAGSTIPCACGGFWQVGNRVKLLVSAPSGNEDLQPGSVGTVVGGSTLTPPLLVQWDGLTSGHDGNGFCDCPGGCSTPAGTGWYVDCNAITFEDCGDGVLDIGEQCDDTNNDANDCCSPLCTFPTGCKAAGKSKISYTNSMTDEKDKLSWKWSQGAATTMLELGNPTASNNYLVCMRTPSTEMSFDLPSGSKWVASGTTGFKFLDPSGTPSGATKGLVKSGDADKAKASVKAGGANLPDAFAGMIDLPLTVDLVSQETGACFTSTFGTSILNDGTKFKATAP